MKTRPYIFILLAIGLLMLWGESQAQRALLPVNFNGPGARARAMGQSFIGVADDATTIDYNPAGLLQLRRPEISAEIKYTLDHHDNLRPDTSFSQDRSVRDDYWDEYLTPSFFGFVYPREKWAVAISEFTSIYFQHQVDDNGWSSLLGEYEYDLEVDMRLYHAGLTFAYNVFPWLDVGVTGK